MAKAKLKRVKKELKKLQRSGRYLEWLAEVQGQPVTPELKREIDQAWQEVQRRTLRTKQAFDEFCAHVDKIQTTPQTPEITFLLALKDLVGGSAEAAERILAFTGLSGAYQAAQKNLAKTLRSPLNWQGIEKLLTLMARDPGKITGKHYRDLAASFSKTCLEQPFLALGNGMAVFRKLNHKTNLQKPLSHKFLADLDHADIQMQHKTELLPAALHRLVFFPFAFQVLLHLRQCTETPATHQVKDLIDSVEMSFSRGAGDLLSPELRDRLFAENEDDLTEAGLKKMEQDFSSASFEDKLALLRDIRQAFQRASHKIDDEFFYSGLFDDDDDDIEEIENLLVRFHKQVLKEIAHKSPDISAREHRALVAVMDPILAQDVSDLLKSQGDVQAVDELLLQAAEAGCLSTRLSVVAHIVSLKGKSKRLGQLAAKALQEAPAPGLEDLRWIMDEHGQLAIQFPAILKELFSKIRGNDDLVQSLARKVWDEVNAGFMLMAFLPEINYIALQTGAPTPSSELKDPTVRRGLAELAGEVEELEPLRRYLAIFSKVHINADNLREWLEYAWTYGENCPLFFETVKALFVGSSETSNLLDMIRSASQGGKFGAAANKLNFTKVLIDFFRDHAGDFRRFPLKTVETIVKKIFPFLKELPDYGSLLIKTSNALFARVSAGEKEFTALRNDLDSQLREIAKPSRGRGRFPRR